MQSGVASVIQSIMGQDNMMSPTSSAGGGEAQWNPGKQALAVYSKPVPLANRLAR